MINEVQEAQQVPQPNRSVYQSEIKIIIMLISSKITTVNKFSPSLITSPSKSLILIYTNARDQLFEPVKPLALLSIYLNVLVLYYIFYLGKRVVQGKLNFKKETMEERRKNLEKIALTEKQKLAAAEKERQRTKDNLKKRMEDVRLKQKEEKLKVTEVVNYY